MWYHQYQMGYGCAIVDMLRKFDTLFRGSRNLIKLIFCRPDRDEFRSENCINLESDEPNVVILQTSKITNNSRKKAYRNFVRLD